MCFSINASLLAMLDMALLVDCKDNIVDLFERWGGEHETMPMPTGKTFNFFLTGIFTSSNLPLFFPDKPTTDLFFDGDFGCVFAMTRSIMRMVCVMSKSDWLLTTHLTPLGDRCSINKMFLWQKI